MPPLLLVYLNENTFDTRDDIEDKPKWDDILKVLSNVVETIVDFAKKQNIQTVGEYVENEEIYDILRALGVDYSQGYFFGKPDTLN